MSTDEFRALTLVLTVLAMLTVPAAIWLRVKSPAVLLIVVVLTLQYIGSTIALAREEGEALEWYGTPRIFAAATVSLLYVLFALTHRRNP
jgi:hypothetical protein